MENELREKLIEFLENEFVEVLVFEEENEDNDEFVDDGSVHIRRSGLRFVIDFDQFNFGDRKAEKNLSKVRNSIDNFISNFNNL